MRICEPGRKSNATQRNEFLPTMNGERSRNTLHFKYCVHHFFFLLLFFVWLNFGNARSISTTAFAIRVIKLSQLLLLLMLLTLAAPALLHLSSWMFLFSGRGKLVACSAAVQIRGKRLSQTHTNSLITTAWRACSVPWKLVRLRATWTRVYSVHIHSLALFKRKTSFSAN